MRIAVALILLSLPLLLGACAKRPGASGMPSALPPPFAQREAERPPEPAPSALPSSMPAPARAAFDEHCGGCHRSDRGTAKAAALAVFDLTHEGWLLTLTVAQVKGAIRRMKAISKGNENEREVARSLLDAELSRRGTGASDG